MCSTQLLRVHSKSSPSRGLFEPSLVDADLVVDRPQVAGHLGELALDPLAVGLEEIETLGLVAVALTDERGVAPYVAHRHACRAEPGDHRDPGQVAVGVATVSGGGSVDRRQHQSVALVVAQGVRGQSGLLGSLGDGQLGHRATLALRVHSHQSKGGRSYSSVANGPPTWAPSARSTSVSGSASTSAAYRSASSWGS